MSLKSLLLLIILHQTVATTEIDDESCMELFKTLAKPISCCKYPQRNILPAHQEKCKNTCDKIGDKTGGCCAIDCNYHSTGTFDGQKFSEKALLELYENDLKEHGAGKFDQWLPIVESSIEKCQKMIPTSDEVYVCNVPQYVLDIMDCVDQQNFMSCPTSKFANSTECEELKSFVEKSEKCGRKVNGNFIIDYRIFEVKEEE